jgi:methionyl-tRNA formyltransferase
MRIVFMGTPAFAVASLEALHREGYDIAGVVTATDKPGGRGRKQLVPSPVAVYARTHQLYLLQPEKLRDPVFLESLRALRAELFVVVAFRMLPEVVWSMPPLGSVNLHGSLLPAYRGAAPIHWAILNGERETGLTVFFLKQDIDTGDILHTEGLPIGPAETTGHLHDRMMSLGARVLCRAVRRIREGDYTLRPQPEQAPSHAPKIYPDMARLDPGKPTAQLLRWVHGMNPTPTAWFKLAGKKIKVFRAVRSGGTLAAPPGTLVVLGDTLCLTASDGSLELQELQPEGSRRMSARDFLNGMQWTDGFATPVDFH